MKTAREELRRQEIEALNDLLEQEREKVRVLREAVRDARNAMRWKPYSSPQLENVVRILDGAWFRTMSDDERKALRATLEGHS